MKNFNITAILLFLLIGNSCAAQSVIEEIINIEDNDGYETENAYYKDTNNLLDPFVGTWIMENNTQYLKIVFEKKTMVNAGNCYEDLLIGEFQYKENNIQLANTLDKLTDPLLPNEYHHSIDGNYIMTRPTPFNEYTTDNFRIGLTMSEPTGCASYLDVRIATVNGQPAIQIFKRGGIITVQPGDPEPPEAIIPGGFYFLIHE